MRTPRTVVAVDLGAESGRVATVGFDGTSLDLEVAHRFVHEPRTADGILRWELPLIRREVDHGLGVIAGGDRPVSSVGVDTWGVDYGLLGPDDQLIDWPTCYRDPRQVRAMDHALKTVGAAGLYEATGVQIIAINTVFGLLADQCENPERLKSARRLLMMPDVLHHMLCGSHVTEFTAASTSGMYDMAGRQWAWGLLDRLGISSSLMPEVVPPGTDIGGLSDASGALRDARVVVPAGHDTASAVVAIPFERPHAMFISSGTWSLVGVETERPILTEASRRANLTNEGGYAGTTRLLRNVMGLWILQECRRQWVSEGSELTYAEIADQAARAPGWRSLIVPDATIFLSPGDMPTRIRYACERADMPVPQGMGEIARCVVDSLALSYASVADDIATVTGVRPPEINIVGGGASHALLSQLTADATGVPVTCGPVEATTLGNGAVQLASLGEFDGLSQIREVIAATVDTIRYEPRPDDRWAEARARFARLPRLKPAETPGAMRK